jgi:hypothetical protein
MEVLIAARLMVVEQGMSEFSAAIPSSLGQEQGLK